MFDYIRVLIASVLSGAWEREEGQTLVEYAVFVVLLIGIIAGLVTLLSGGLTNEFTAIKNAL